MSTCLQDVPSRRNSFCRRRFCRVRSCRRSSLSQTSGAHPSYNNSVHHGVQFADRSVFSNGKDARRGAGGVFMRSIKRNGKWLAGVACTVLVAGAAIGWGEVRNSARPHVEARDVRALSAVFREVAKSARPAVVTIETTSKPMQVRGNVRHGERPRHGERSLWRLLQEPAAVPRVLPASAAAAARCTEWGPAS